MLKKVLKRMPGLRGLAQELTDLRLQVQAGQEREQRAHEERLRLQGELQQARDMIGRLQLCGASSDLDDILVPEAGSRAPAFCGHSVVWPWLQEHINRPGLEVLEIGSRLVVARALWKEYLPDVQYTGFDYLPGPNVDVVGGAHRLSQYLTGRQFDFVFSCAVFEHLVCPWLVVEEISKVLRPGGQGVHRNPFFLLGTRSAVALLPVQQPRPGAAVSPEAGFPGDRQRSLKPHRRPLRQGKPGLPAGSAGEQPVRPLGDRGGEGRSRGPGLLLARCGAGSCRHQFLSAAPGICP